MIFRWGAKRDGFIREGNVQFKLAGGVKGCEQPVFKFRLWGVIVGFTFIGILKSESCPFARATVEEAPHD